MSLVLSGACALVCSVAANPAVMKREDTGTGEK
jgi:hypothetical protein